MEAIADLPAYNRARAALRFDEISRALVHGLKYGDRLDLAPMMGRWISQAGREVLAEADALVPVAVALAARSVRDSPTCCAVGLTRLSAPAATGSPVWRDTAAASMPD